MKVPVQQIGNVEIRVTNRCNALCAHCVEWSSPEEEGVLSAEDARKALDALVSRWGSPRYWKLSGGEPMLYPERTLEIARMGAEAGTEARLVTNGFWATSVERARTEVAAFSEAGIRHVWISADSFHVEFIPAQHIRDLITALKEAGLAFYVNFCYVLPRAEAPGSRGLPVIHNEIARDAETLAFHREVASIVDEGAHGWARVFYEGRGKEVIDSLGPHAAEARRILAVVEEQDHGPGPTAGVELRQDGVLLLRDGSCNVNSPEFCEFLDSYLPQADPGTAPATEQ